MQVVLRIANLLIALATYLNCGHIEVDHNLDLWNIDTSCKHISCNDHADFTCSELFDHFVAFLVAHITENNGRFEVLTAHHLMQAVRIGLSIDENDCLGHLTDIKDSLDELRLFALFASVFELLNVIKRKLLLFKIDLVSLTRELGHCLLDIFCIRR